MLSPLSSVLKIKFGRMNNGWKIVLFLLLSFHAMASVFSSVGTSYEVTYTVKDGLPQNSVADILKNDDGLIWVCTKDGLSRFDGYDFKNFKADSKKLNRSVSNQFVRLQKDAAGCLWILNDIGQVLRFDTKNESFQLFPSAEDNKGDDYFTTVRMKKLGAEEFWMIGNEEVGAIRLLIDTLSHVSMHRFFYNECNVKEVFRDNNHGRWILGENALYNIMDRDMVYSKFAWQDDEKLLTMIDVSNECVIGAERGKIVKFDKQKRWFTSFQLPVKKNIEYLYSLKTHYCCAITSDGWLFVINLIDNSIAYQKDLPAQIEEIRQSENGDIYLKMAWENASCKVSASSLELESGTVEAVYFPASIKDTLGVRWHATEAGLSKQVDFNNSFQYHLCVDPATLKTSTDISAVMEDEKKRLWVASKDGVVRLFDTDMNIIGYLNGQGNISKKETTFAAVSVIYQDRSNRIWMATEKNLVYLSRQSDLSYNVTRCVADEKEFAPLSDNINDILEDSKGRIWRHNI